MLITVINLSLRGFFSHKVSSGERLPNPALVEIFVYVLRNVFTPSIFNSQFGHRAILTPPDSGPFFFFSSVELLASQGRVDHSDHSFPFCVPTSSATISYEQFCFPKISPDQSFKDGRIRDRIRQVPTWPNDCAESHRRPVRSHVNTRDRSFAPKSFISDLLYWSKTQWLLTISCILLPTFPLTWWVLNFIDLTSMLIDVAFELRVESLAGDGPGIQTQNLLQAKSGNKNKKKKKSQATSVHLLPYEPP